MTIIKQKLQKNIINITQLYHYMKINNKIKNILLIGSICAVAETSIANAKTSSSGLYIGVDALHASVKHKYLAEGTQVSTNGYTSNDESIGYGLNLGYKLSGNKAFIAPELFFEDINSSAKDFGYEQAEINDNNSLNVRRRYGGRINIGYNLVSKLNVFANAGLANVDYSVKIIGITGDAGANHITSKVATFVPVYGFGFSYDLTNHWSLKASYDWQQFTVRYDFAVEKDRILLQTTKFGVAYKF